MSSNRDWPQARARYGHGLLSCWPCGGRLCHSTPAQKRGEPDIEIPALFAIGPVSGISAADSERLLVKPMGKQTADLDGLKDP